MADKADWYCDANLRHFIDIYKGEIETGNMPLEIFSKTRMALHNFIRGSKLHDEELDVMLMRTTY